MLPPRGSCGWAWAEYSAAEAYFLSTFDAWLDDLVAVLECQTTLTAPTQVEGTSPSTSVQEEAAQNPGDWQTIARNSGIEDPGDAPPPPPPPEGGDIPSTAYDMCVGQIGDELEIAIHPNSERFTFITSLFEQTLGS